MRRGDDERMNAAPAAKETTAVADTSSTTSATLTATSGTTSLEAPPTRWQRLLRWPYAFLVVFSVVVGLFTIWTSEVLDLPLRDPEGFLGPAYVRLPALGLVFIGGGVLGQALYQNRSLRGLGRKMAEIVRRDWTWGRLGHATLGLVCFYICYVSYRNLKSFLPIVREDVLYDTDLMKLDHFLFFGHFPATVLHSLLGTGVSAVVLSAIYVSYLPLVPISLAAVLVLKRDVSLGAWYATALSLNWILGAASYYALPTLGPVFAAQSLYSDLPANSGVAALQASLARNGYDVRFDPWNSDSIYGIAGFASLHVSVVLTAVLFFQIIGTNKWFLRILWIYFVGVVLATTYFGWHYIADDIAGALIAVVSLAIGAAVTGNWNYRKKRKAALAESA